MNSRYIPQDLCVNQEEFNRRCESISSHFTDNYDPEINECYASTNVDFKGETPTARNATKIRKQPLNLNRNPAKQWRKERRAFYIRLKELKRMSSKFI